MDYILSYIFSTLALIITCYGYFVKNKKLFLLIQIISTFLYALSYITLSIYTTGIISLISILRCVYLYLCEKYNFKYTIYFLPLFIMAYIGIGIGFWTSPLDIIPMCTSSMFTIAFYIKNMNLVRYFLILPNVLIVFYTIICKTYVNLILAVLELTIIIIAIIKSYKDTKTKNLSYN